MDPNINNNYPSVVDNIPDTIDVTLVTPLSLILVSNIQIVKKDVNMAISSDLIINDKLKYSLNG